MTNRTELDFWLYSTPKESSSVKPSVCLKNMKEALKRDEFHLSASWLMLRWAAAFLGSPGCPPLTWKTQQIVGTKFSWFSGRWKFWNDLGVLAGFKPENNTRVRFLSQNTICWAQGTLSHVKQPSWACGNWISHRRPRTDIDQCACWVG